MKTTSNERILKRYGVVNEEGNNKNNKVQAINFIYGPTVEDKDGYIGTSTRAEIEYATKTGKKVNYMEKL